MPELKLYHGVSSVCSVKVRIGLAEIGLGYDEVILDLQAGDQHAPEYLALNPDGVVPTLIDRDLVLRESSLIIEYLDREYNDGLLMPRGRAAEATARHWLVRCLAVHSAINTLTYATVMRQRIRETKDQHEIDGMLSRIPDPVAREKRRVLIEQGLDTPHSAQALGILRRTFSDMDRALRQGDWVSGPAFGLSDIALVSFIDRLWRLGLEGFWSHDRPSIGHWLAAMQARPSYESEVTGRIPEAAADEMREQGACHWPKLEAFWKRLEN